MNPAFELPKRFWKGIEAVKALSSNSRYQAAFIFGSVAEGTSTDKSDLDLKVIVDEDNPCENINHPTFDDYAAFRSTNLHGADLRGSDLRQADLSNADLSGANLQDTHLEQAIVAGANVCGADLRAIPPGIIAALRAQTDVNFTGAQWDRPADDSN